MPLQSRILDELRQIVGCENVLTNPEDLYCYSRDASWFFKMPDAVVRPHSRDEVVQIVNLAYRESIPITPRGAGTNLSGGAIPVKGGIVVDMSGMNRIIKIDKPNLTVVIEPGVVHTDLNNQLANYGLFFPPDPASGDACTMGGVVSECGGGMRALKYGTARDWILGLEVVLPNGEVIQTGSSTFKCASGYDLTRLFTRSEGTLGIITKIILKVLPKPEALIRMFAMFDRIEDAASVVAEIFEAGIVPTIMEILDRATIKAVSKFAKLELPEADAILIIDLDGTKEGIEKLSNKVEKIFLESGAKDVQKAINANEMLKLYMARKAALPALARLRPTTLVEDITVPVTKLPHMIKKIQQIARKHSILIATFGHAGDGNLHPTICADERNKEEWQSVMKCHEEICKSAIDLGGTLSGEHGIGLAKAAYLEYEHGKKAVEIMRAIKRVVDPKNIMNPGKMALD